MDKVESRTATIQPGTSHLFDKVNVQTDANQVHVMVVQEIEAQVEGSEQVAHVKPNVSGVHSVKDFSVTVADGLVVQQTN